MTGLLILVFFWLILFIAGAFSVFREDGETRISAFMGACAFSVIWPLLLADVLCAHALRRKTQRANERIRKGADE